MSEATRTGPRGSRVVVALAAVMALSVAGYLMVAMPGMDHGSDAAMSSMTGTGLVSSGIRQVAAATFERLVADPLGLIATADPGERNPPD